MSARMRGSIAFVCRDRLPLWRVDVAGLFGKYLARMGWRIRWHALQPEGEEKPNWLDAGDLVATRLLRDTKGVGAWITERRRDLGAALSILRDAPSVAVVRDDYLSLLFVGLAARLKGIPCAYWMSFLIEDGLVDHGNRSRGLEKLARVCYGRVYGWFGQAFLRAFADIVFTQSEIMSEIVSKRMKYAGRVVPVHMAVDMETLPSSAAKLVDSQDLVVGYAGVISFIRGFQSVLEGLALARSRGIAVRLHLVGWFQLTSDNRILDVIKDLGLEDVVVISGKVPVDEAMRVMSCCDVGLALCPSQPLFIPASPTKLFEYLALGKRVIASKHPVQDRVVSEADAGWIVDDTPESFACAFEKASESKRLGLLGGGDRIAKYCADHHSYAVRAGIVDAELLRFGRGAE